MSSDNTDIELSLLVPFESMDTIVLYNGESRLLTGHMYRRDKVKAFLSEHYPLVEKIILKFRLGCSAGHTGMTRDLNWCLDAVMGMVSICTLVLKVELARGDSQSRSPLWRTDYLSWIVRLSRASKIRQKLSLVSLVW